MHGRKKVVIVGGGIILLLAIAFLIFLWPKKESKGTKLPTNTELTDSVKTDEDEVWVDGNFADDTSQESTSSFTEDTWTGNVEDKVEMTDGFEEDVTITNDNDNYLPIIPPEFDE